MGGICQTGAGPNPGFQQHGIRKRHGGDLQFEFGLSNSRSADGIFDADDNYSLKYSLPVTELSG